MKTPQFFFSVLVASFLGATTLVNAQATSVSSTNTVTTNAYIGSGATSNFDVQFRRNNVNSGRLATTFTAFGLNNFGFLLDKYNYLTGNCTFWIGECNSWTGKCNVWTGNCKFWIGKCNFLTGKCNVWTGECNSLTGKSNFLTDNCFVFKALKKKNKKQ